MRIAEDLHLDVPRPFDEAFGEQPPVAEVALALAARHVDGLGQARGLAHDLHALAAAAGRTLDQQRETDCARAFGKAGRVVGLVGRGRDRHALLHREAPRADLVAHALDDLGTRADEHQPGLGHRAREGGVLRQEAVAGVHRVAAAVARRAHDAGDVQEGRDRRLAEELHRLRRLRAAPGHGDRPHARARTVAMPSRRAVRTMRSAISARLAMKSLRIGCHRALARVATIFSRRATRLSSCGPAPRAAGWMPCSTTSVQRSAIASTSMRPPRPYSAAHSRCSMPP